MRKRGWAFWLLTLLAVWTTVNGVVADFNYTHLLNPAWSPHAKFHDWVSVVTAILCGLAALFYHWRGGEESLDHLEFSTVLQFLFWLALILGYTFPGVTGTTGEHPEFVPKVLGIRLNEAFLSITSMIFIALGYWFERRRRAQ